MAQPSDAPIDNPAWLQPVIIIVLLINYLILFPTAIRFMKSTWSIQRETYMQSRLVNISIISAISLLIIIIIHPVLLCLYFWPLRVAKDINKLINIIIHTLVVVLSIIPLIGVSLRLWLIYFSHKFSAATFKERRIGLQIEKKEELQNRSTKYIRTSVSPFVTPTTTTPKVASFDNINANNLKHLNLSEMDLATTTSKSSVVSLSPKSDVDETELIKMESTLINPLQFWIDNKNTFGSFRFMKYCILIAFIIDICIISICSFIQILISYFIQTILYILLLIFIQFHVYKLSPFHDEFFVRKQFITELKIIYLNFILWIITLFIWYITRSRDEYDEYNIYNNNTDINIRIAIRFLLDGNMTLTSFLLIIAQFAIPLFRFEQGIDRLSNRNVLTKENKKKRLKIPLFQCIMSRNGYYLFMEYLMKEFSVENLLFITEVAFMKQKFEKTLLIPRNKSNENSVATSLKNAFQSISEKKASQENESSVSRDSYNNNNNNNNHQNVPSASSSSILSATNTKKSTGGRVAKLRDIPSDDAIVTTQSEVENIMNKTAEQVIGDNNMEENKYNNNENESESETEEQSITDHEENNKIMMEMGVINGKKLTITTNMFNKPTTTNIIDGKQKNATVNLPKLPHTVTMAESMKQNNLFDSVDMIYDNFIDKKARYQINISSTVRACIAKIVIQHRLSVETQREKLKSINVDRVIPSSLSGIIVDVHIFDDAANEILALLRSSYYRFAQSKQYKVYCAAMGK